MKFLLNLLRNHVSWVRPPDKIIGGNADPYLLRWHVIPRNRLFNIYLHRFLRSDDPRALHDHPWCNLSILLEGEYTEVIPTKGGTTRDVIRRAGHWVARLPTTSHRICLHIGPCWTLFITGPKVREWGFWVPGRGWMHWVPYTRKYPSGDINGGGCE